MAGEAGEMGMMPMMGPGGDNMKFNIIFTVGKPGEMYGEEEEEEEDSEAEYNSDEEEGPEIEEVEKEDTIQTDSAEQLLDQDTSEDEDFEIPAFLRRQKF